MPSLEQELRYIILFFGLIGLFPYSKRKPLNVAFIFITIFRIGFVSTTPMLLTLPYAELFKSVSTASGWILYFYLTFSACVCLVQSLLQRKVMMDFYQRLDNVRSVYFVEPKGNWCLVLNLGFVFVIFLVGVFSVLEYFTELFSPNVHFRLTAFYDITCLMKGIQFVFHVYLVKVHLIAIDLELMRLRDIQKDEKKQRFTNNQQSGLLNGQTHLLKHAYNEMYELTRNINKSFGFTLIFIVQYMFSKVLLGLYRSCIEILSGDGFHLGKSYESLTFFNPSLILEKTQKLSFHLILLIVLIVSTHSCSNLVSAQKHYIYNI